MKALRHTLRRSRSAIVTTLITATAAIPAIAQQPTATVKPATAASPGSPRGIRVQPGGVFTARAVTLRELIQYAYQRHPLDRREMTGGPAWLDSARFDIEARSTDENWIDPDGASRKSWGMLRTLLTERFQLRTEEAQSTRSVYVLTKLDSSGKLGPKIQRSAADCGAMMRGKAPARAEGQPPPCSMKTPPGRLFASTVTMPTLATLLSSHLDRPVIDRTGLDGRFDVQLEAAEIKAPPGYRPGPSDLALPPAAGPSIWIAVQEQLGLKLEPQVTPVTVLVVREAQRPSPE